MASILSSISIKFLSVVVSAETTQLRPVEWRNLDHDCISVVFDNDAVLLGVQGVVEVSEGHVEVRSVRMILAFVVKIWMIVIDWNTLAIYSDYDARVVCDGKSFDLVFAEENFDGLSRERVN